MGVLNEIVSRDHASYAGVVIRDDEMAQPNSNKEVVHPFVWARGLHGVRGAIHHLAFIRVRVRRRGTRCPVYRVNQGKLEGCGLGLGHL